MALAALATPAEAQRHKWWKDERFQKELSLTPEQSTKIEEIFQALQPTMRAQMRALDKLEDELSKIIHDAQVQEAELEQFVARVEAARADLSKTRTVMLFRVRKVLTTEQHLKLLQLFEQDEKQRRSRPHPGRGK